MFEGVVASLLNKYLGKYIQNLDTENLNLGIFSGTVELTDLKLKPEALYELDLPIEVKVGSVGKISLDIPWTSLYSEPVIVNVEDVFLLAGPVTDRQYDPEHERALLRAEKKRKLDELSPSSVESSSDDEESKGFLEKLTATIVNNLQVAIRNVHIRYEDVVTDKNNLLSCGIMLQSITASSTNSKWKPSQIDSSASSIFKLIKMESLSIYWNPNCNVENMTRNYISSNRWKNVMNDGLATFSVNNEDFDFMVKPISAKVKVILSKLNDAKVPKLLVDFLLQDVASQFSRQQYMSVLKLIQSFQMMSVNRQYLKYRPEVTLKNNANLWWKYAYTSILEEYIRPYSWERIKKHRQYYREYKNLYKQKLWKPNDAETKMDLQKLEDHLDVVNILLAREHAKLDFIKEEPERAKHKKEKHSSWWSRWFGSGDDEEKYIEIVGEDTTLWSKLTPEEKEKIYDAIGYTEGEKSPNKPLQYIEHKINFTLANCALSLVNNSKEILVMTLTQFLMSVETRPSADAFRLSARTESFVVEGASVEHDLVPIITADHATSGSGTPHVFAVDFEKNPLHIESEFGLSLNAEPMEVVYHEHSVSEVISYFIVPDGLVGNLKDAAKQKLMDLAEVSKLALKYAIEQHKKIFINIDLKSPYLVLPERGTLQKGGNILVLDFGRLTIKSDMQHGTISLEDATKMEIEERLYDRFNVVLSDIQVLFADSGDSWRESRLLSESESHIMPKMRIQLMFSNNVKPDYKLIPRQKLNTSIPSLKLNLSDRKVRQLVEFVDNFPMPKFSPSGVDVVDGHETDSSDWLPDPQRAKLLASIDDLKRIRLQLLSTQPSENKNENASNISSDNNKHATMKTSVTSSDHSDEEPEEWARMVDLPGFDDNMSASNTIRTLLRFLIGEVVVQLARSSDHVDKPYLMLRIDKLCTDIALMEYGPAVQASIGGVQLVDKLHTAGLSGEYLELVNSTGQSDMITLLYRKVTADCPEFRSHFHSVEQSVVIDITTIDLTFHRGAFITLSKFLQYVMEKVKTKEKTTLSRQSSILASAPDPSTLLATNIDDPPIPSGATKLSVSARMDEVKIKLCDSDVDLAFLQVAGLESDFVQKANEKMIIRAHLTYILLEDLTESTLYPKILSMEDDKVIEFKYVKHSSSHKSGTFEDPEKVHSDGCLRLRVGRILIVLLYKFITDMHRFLEPFFQPDFTSKAIKSAEKAVQQQVTDIKNKGTNLSLSIDIHAPTLLIPQKSSSPNLLAVMLGDLSIENFFKEVSVASYGAVDSNHIVDNLLIRLNSLQMSRAVILINGSMETQESILEPVKFRVDVKRAMMPFHRDILSFDIQGSMDTIKLNLGQRDFGTILAIYKENFYEGQFGNGSRPSSRPLSPVNPPTPVNTESEDVRKLEEFLNKSVDVYKDINVSFVLEGIELSLYQDSDEVLSSPVRDLSHGLSRFEMDEVSVTLTMYNDRAIEIKCALQAVTLYDIRPDSSLAIRKIFQSYSGDSKQATGPISISMPPMIDVTFRQNNNGDAAVDILIEKTRLNVSVPYLLAVSKFLYDAIPGNESSSSSGDSVVADHTTDSGAAHGMKVGGLIDGITRKRHPSDTTSGYHSTTSGSSALDDMTALSITAKLKKPEIILFADPSDKNSKVLVLKTNGYFDYSRNLGQANIIGSVSGLQIFSCMYGKRKQTAYMVLQPCDAEFTRSMKSADEGVNMTASLSKITLKISSSTVHTVTEVTQQFLESNRSEPESYHETKELSDLWSPKKILPHKWITSTEDEICFRPRFPIAKAVETLTVNIPSVEMLFEIEEGPRRIPYVMLRSALEANINDWSKKLHMKAELQLEVMYYNDKLSVWEPIIEPVMEAENSYRPWELIIKVFKERSLPITCSHDEKDGVKAHQSRIEINSVTSRVLSEDVSSESEVDTENEMTIVKKRPASTKRPINSISRENSSLVAAPIDSDSETEEGMLEKISNAFSHLFSSGDSSDDETADSGDELETDKKQGAQISEEDATDTADVEPLSVDEGPVFLSGTANQGNDVTDAGTEEPAENLAMYVMIDSRDKLNISVTPEAIDVISDVYQSYMEEPEFPVKDFMAAADTNSYLRVKNLLGPDSLVQVLKSSEGGSSVDECMMESSSSPEPRSPVVSTPTAMLVDISPSDSDIDDDNEECDGYSVLSAFSQAGSVAVSVVGTVFGEEDVSELYKETTKEKISVQVTGFEKLVCLMPRRVGTRIFSLIPLKQQDRTRYHIAIDTNIYHGKKIITSRSLLKVENNLESTVYLYCKKKSLDTLGLPSPPSKNPFQDNIRLTSLAPSETYNVPLFVAYHCKLFVQPADTSNNSTPSLTDECDQFSYQTSDLGISWQDLIIIPSGSKHFVCKPTQMVGPSYTFKVTKKDGPKFQSVNNKQVPNYTLSLCPPVVFHNHLPCPIELDIKGTDEKYELSVGHSCPITFFDNVKSQEVSIEVTQYLGLPWIGTMDLSIDMDDHKTINMRTDHDTEGGNKQLGLNVDVKRRDSLDIYLYAPYWIVNKTKLPIQFRGSGSDSVYESNASEEPILFRFKKHRRKKARIRVYNSLWSQSFSLDTVASSGVVICSDKERHKKYQFLMEIELSKLKLTKIITILPYFIIINDTNRNVMFMEENQKTDLWLDISPNQCMPFWPDTSSMQLCVKFRDSKIISQHFSINKTQNTVLRMDNGSALCVEVSGGLKNPITISLQPYVIGYAPARVENLCEDLFLKIHQKDMGQVTLLSPYQSVLYTWDDPAKDRVLMWNLYNRKRPGYSANIFSDGYGQEKLTFHSLKKATQATQINRASAGAVSSSDDDDSEAEEGSFHHSKIRKDKVIVHWVSYMDGHQRVLLFTQDERVAKQVRKSIDEKATLELFASLNGIGLSLINAMYREIAYVSINGSPAIWEVEINGKMKLLNVELSTWLEDNYQAEQDRAELKDYIHVDFSKMLMTKPFFGLLRRTYNPAFWFQYRQSKHQMYIHSKIHRIQIDNQLPDAVFPTVFWPAPIPHYVVKKSGAKPLVEFAVMRRSVVKTHINNFKFVKLLVQEFNVMLDKGFMLSTYDVFSDYLDTEDAVAKMTSDLLYVHTSLKELSQRCSSSRPQKLMIDYLHLSPLKINLSFSLRGTVYKGKPDAPSFGQDIIEFFLSSVGATISEVKDVELKMAFLEERSTLISPAQLMEDIKDHYVSQVVQQWYVLVLGLDVLGNPYGLIKDFTKGLGDFFYEPFLGSVQGPETFAIGISRGAQSLFGHVIGGVAGSVSLITGSFGQALTALSFDEEYKKRRRIRMQQHAGNLPSTLVVAAKGFVLGVALGLSGVVVKPITGAPEYHYGAKQEGVEGFFKGIGKGILGIVTKPAVGVFDMVSMAFDGIRRAAEMGEDVVVRIRLPRFINPKLGLRPYSPYEATGFNLLNNLSKGHYVETDTYWAYAALSRQDRSDVVLITDRHVFMLERCRFWGGWDTEWQLLIDDIMSVPQISNNKLIFRVKKEETFTFFSDDDKYILCDDQQVLRWLQKKLEKALILNIEDKPCPSAIVKTKQINL